MQSAVVYQNWGIDGWGALHFDMIWVTDEKLISLVLREY